MPNICLIPALYLKEIPLHLLFTVPSRIPSNNLPLAALKTESRRLRGPPLSSTGEARRSPEASEEGFHKAVSMGPAACGEEEEGIDPQGNVHGRVWVCMGM